MEKLFAKSGVEIISHERKENKNFIVLVVDESVKDKALSLNDKTLKGMFT